MSSALVATPGGPLVAGGGTAGSIIGGLIFGGVGGFFGPGGVIVGRAVGARVGRWAGRAAGAALQDYLADGVEAADEAADALNEPVASQSQSQTESQAQSSEKTEAKEEKACKSCEERCRELQSEINDEMYANKRARGNRGKHGLRNRRVEQICGAAGPGTTQMKRVLKDGVWILKEVDGWANHADEIAKQQEQLRRKLREYDEKVCKQYADSGINRSEAERMASPDFNPSAGEWLGRDHPSCQGVGDLLRNNDTPELPSLPRSGSNEVPMV